MALVQGMSIQIWRRLQRTGIGCNGSNKASTRIGVGDAKFEGRMHSIRIPVDHVVIEGRLPSVAGLSCPV